MNSQAIRKICRSGFLQIHLCTNICLPTGSLGLCWSKTIGISAVACFHPSWFWLHQCQHIFWSQSRWSTEGSATLVGILRSKKSRKRDGRKLTCFARNTNDKCHTDAYVKDVNDPYLNEITYILLSFDQFSCFAFSHARGILSDVVGHLVKICPASTEIRGSLVSCEWESGNFGYDRVRLQ